MRMQELALISFFLGAAVPAVTAHGNMIWPPVWQGFNNSQCRYKFWKILHWNAGKNRQQIGNWSHLNISQDSNATYGLTKYSIFSIGNDLIWYDDPQKFGNILMWYSNIVYIPDGIEPTLQVSLLNRIRKWWTYKSQLGNYTRITWGHGPTPLQKLRNILPDILGKHLVVRWPFQPVALEEATH